MKASSKFVLTAVLFFVATAVAYNTVLTAEYRKGEYKDPYLNYSDLNLKGFTDVAISGAHNMRFKVIQGEHKVYVHKNAAAYVQVKQDGNRLIVRTVLPEKVNYQSNIYQVVIAVPELKSLQTDAAYTSNGEEVIIDNAMELFTGYSGVSVVLEDLEVDSLSLTQDHGSKVTLKNNRINALHATVGMKSNSYSILELYSSNKIANADLQIQNRSELVMQDLRIPNLNYTFSERAKATMTGASLASVLKK
ncbi:hypothetical protein [Pontibacter akesuensis]|uniref:Auto-transporter adhesin head GIN domain-containing protein n=1 Tax=Pontibacter akesuensis TaxID=388950 RepID=A0A1I7KEU6_9BACT|nr:hypothetical protein [Pontibacter akesuensis]GHA79760.1 hypothetical protein GCM10007389_37490 [Pontibacter akesuensis]SFU95910.1 hypothetical protein SAMN04487941_3640 [Pontibacter akesuensis]